jgi:hypothetical protein
MSLFADGTVILNTAPLQVLKAASSVTLLLDNQKNDQRGTTILHETGSGFAQSRHSHGTLQAQWRSGIRILMSLFAWHMSKQTHHPGPPQPSPLMWVPKATICHIGTHSPTSIQTLALSNSRGRRLDHPEIWVDGPARPV